MGHAVPCDPSRYSDGEGVVNAVVSCIQVGPSLCAHIAHILHPAPRQGSSALNLWTWGLFHQFLGGVKKGRLFERMHLKIVP